MDNWFTIDEIDANTYIISEYRHWEETHCYLLNGKMRSLLIDTGLGISNIYEEFEFPHFSNRYHLKPNPAKHPASVSCCDCSFLKMKPFMPECVLARTRSMA